MQENAQQNSARWEESVQALEDSGQISLSMWHQHPYSPRGLFFRDKAGVVCLHEKIFFYY